MLRSLVVEGVKSLEGRHEVLLAPVTLVFGPNSAGKSTLLHSLLLLQQSVLNGPWDDPQLLPRGDAVNLGSFRNLVSGHDETRAVVLGLSASLDADGRSPLTVGVEATFRLEYGVPRLQRTDLTWADDPVAIPRRVAFDVRRDARVEVPPAFEMGLSLSEPSVRQWFIDILAGPLATGPWLHARELAEVSALPSLPVADVEAACDGLRGAFTVDQITQAAENLTGWVPRRWSVHSDAAGDATKAAVSLLEWLLRTADVVLRRELQDVRSIGPLRKPFPRVEIAGGSQRRTGWRDEQALDLLVRDEGLRAEVNDWLGRLEMGYSISPIDVSTGQLVDPDHGGDPVLGDVIALRFIEEETGLAVSPSDVGFGVVQVVPVVVQALAAQSGTLLVEQPELHLHPRLQAELGELFAARSAQTAFILETHSEHLVLRLARLVKNDSLFDADRIRIIVVRPPEPDTEPTGGLELDPRLRATTVIQEVELNDDGRFITPWPGGFFPERERELYAMDIVDATEETP